VIKRIIFKNRFQIFLLIIIVIGLWLRFYNLPNQVWSQAGYDEARDMLVAEHIYKYKETVNRGPLAAGGLNYLMNSPVYYYLVTFLWMITQNPTSMMYLWASLLTTQIPLAYLVGKQLGDKTTGIIAAIVFALHNQLIFQSREVWQPNLLPIFSLLFLWVLLKNQKKKSLALLLLMIFLLLFPLHLHYGVFLILPVGVFWVSYFWSQILENNLSLKNIFLPVATTVGLIFSWLITTYKVKIFDQIFFLLIILKGSDTSFFNKSHELISKLKHMLWADTPSYLAVLITFILITFSFFCKKERSRSKKTNWIIISLAFSALIGGLFPKEILTSYFFSTLPFFLILFSLGIRQLISINNYLGLVVVSVILFLIYLPTQNLIFFQTPSESFLEQNYKVAEVIFSDQKNMNHEGKYSINFGIVALSTTVFQHFDGWGTSGVWFYLEELFDKPLVKLTNYGVSHYPITTDINYLYFVCDHRTLPELINESCLNRFVEDRNYLSDYPDKIYQSQNYTVWKAAVDSKKHQGSYYHVH
jgi:4-amino-4-deoxy-L-arabinose transferase-like glycosyltransferase